MKAVLVLALVALCTPALAELKHLVRIDGNVWRGRQPGRDDFPELAQMGFKTVLDLRGGMIHKPRERKLVEAAGMRYISVRLSGIWEPKRDQIEQALAVLEDRAHGPMFVHCRRGYDRVGLVIACYHIAHDHWTNQEALADARHNGLNRFELLMRRYISTFRP